MASGQCQSRWKSCELVVDIPPVASALGTHVIDPGGVARSCCGCCCSCDAPRASEEKTLRSKILLAVSSSQNDYECPEQQLQRRKYNRAEVERRTAGGDSTLTICAQTLHAIADDQTSATAI